MSPHEYASVVRFIEERWAGTKNWRSPALAADFTNVTYKALMKAIDTYRNDPNNLHAPKPMQMRAQAIRIMQEQGDMRPGAHTCDTRGSHGALAILPHDDLEKRENGLRIAICVECHTQWVGDKHRFPTVGEVEEYNRQNREHPNTGPIEGDRSERIAP